MHYFIYLHKGNGFPERIWTDTKCSAISIAYDYRHDRNSDCRRIVVKDENGAILRDHEWFDGAWVNRKFHPRGWDSVPGGAAASDPAPMALPPSSPVELFPGCIAMSMDSFLDQLES